MKKHTIVAALLIFVVVPLLGQDPAVSPLSADEVMARVFERDSQRESLGRGYSGIREYVLENHRMNKHGEMMVSVVCDMDGTKHFEMISEDGWKSANKHVLRKMLESESETSLPVNRPKTRLIPDNYTFQMEKVDIVEGRPTYVIEVNPRRSDEYLFHGLIWVDAEDFAVAQAEGRPARNPSFWTRSVHFVQQYQKSGPFWFPSTTTSVTDARIFGTTDVSIRYFNYKPVSETSSALTGPPLTEAHYVQH
jgi:hypothetical protein